MTILMKHTNHFIILTISLFIVLPITQAQQAPYPPSDVIKDVQFDWSTHRRAAQGRAAIIFNSPGQTTTINMAGGETAAASAAATAKGGLG